MSLLQVAYLIDAIVTAPLVVAVLTHNKGWIANLLGPAVPGDPSSLMLIGVMWAALLTMATTGLVYPHDMAPILIVQLIYKGLWLVLFALPRWLGGRSAEVPRRVAALFAAYVGTYPWVIPWSQIFERS